MNTGVALSLICCVVGAALSLPAKAADCDGGATLNENVSAPYVLDGKIDGKCVATITATTIQIKGRIDGKSTANLTAVVGALQ